ncbi:MAG TPA: GDSL-type esterase/lipase family protein [Kiritimatiellia bacterium]|nr:GDSL-type esterase/lipase family protein [Kiritimatiellia bacterium]
MQRGFIVAGCLLFLALILCAWIALTFRDRLHQIIVNKRWEQKMAANNFYADRIIVFFGDSQLAGWRLAPSFGTLPIKNRGINGDRAARAIHRFEHDVIRENATMVVILIGINDLGGGATVDEVVASIDGILAKAREHRIEVVLGSILPLQGGYYSPEAASMVRHINALLAARANVTFVDFHTALLDHDGRMTREYTDDGLHPNARGYSMMTKLLQPVLIRHLAREEDAESTPAR